MAWNDVGCRKLLETWKFNWMEIGNAAGSQKERLRSRDPRSSSATHPNGSNYPVLSLDAIIWWALSHFIIMIISPRSHPPSTLDSINIFIIFLMAIELNRLVQSQISRLGAWSPAKNYSTSCPSITSQLTEWATCIIRQLLNQRTLADGGRSVGLLVAWWVARSPNGDLRAQNFKWKWFPDIEMQAAKDCYYHWNHYLTNNLKNNLRT